jgi:hypothetical protein
VVEDAGDQVVISDEHELASWRTAVITSADVLFRCRALPSSYTLSKTSVIASCTPARASLDPSHRGRRPSQLNGSVRIRWAHLPVVRTRAHGRLFAHLRSLGWRHHGSDAQRAAARPVICQEVRRRIDKSFACHSTALSMMCSGALRKGLQPKTRAAASPAATRVGGSPIRLDEA